MIIDTHVHVYGAPSFADLSEQIRTMQDAIAFRTRHSDLFRRAAAEVPVDNTDALISDMDRHGVDFALVQARSGCSNAQLVATVKRHPGRLGALGIVGHMPEGGAPEDPVSVREAAEAEVEYCLGTLEMKGIGEPLLRALTNEIHPERIAQDLSGIMRVIERYRVPIQFPTAWTQFTGGLFYGDPLWVDEVAGRHPGVPIVLTKMGRSITRFFDSAMTVALRNPNVYFDVVGTSPEHLRLAIETLGAERIMFGTDWSATWRWLSVPAPLHEIRLKVLDDAKLSSSEREQILWKTATRLFKLEAEVAIVPREHGASA